MVIQWFSCIGFMREKGIHVEKGRFMIALYFYLNMWVNNMHMYFVLKSEKIRHRQEESLKPCCWQDRVNNSDLDFIHKQQLSHTQPCVLPNRNWSECQDFLICLHFSQNFFAPDSDRIRLPLPVLAPLILFLLDELCTLSLHSPLFSSQLRSFCLEKQW